MNMDEQVIKVLQRGDNSIFSLREAYDTELATPHSTLLYALELPALGYGAQGAVFKAHHVRLGISVAVKFELVPSGYPHKRFLREAQLAARASAHANVIGVYDYGLWSSSDCDVLYLVCEFMPHGDLRRMASLANDDRDVLEDKFNAIGEAVSGIEHMHDVGLVHRDIKPANLLLGPEHYVRVADFGFARDLQLPTSSSSGHLSLSAPGTPGYQAPEVVLGTTPKNDPAAKAVDIFALGVTIYELLYSRLPFLWSSTSDGQNQWLEEVRRGPHFPTSEPQIPLSLQDCISQMLSYHPDSRLDVHAVRTIVEREVHRIALQISPEFEQIRRAITRKIQDICTVFSGARSTVVPQTTEDKSWYMTILVRPTKAVANPKEPLDYTTDREPMADVLYPIYLPHYELRHLRHCCDWLETPNQPFTPLHVRHCCSGIPIDYHSLDERERWESHNLINNDFVRIAMGDNNKIEYVILTNVRQARFGDDYGPPPSRAALVTERYLTDHDRPGSRGLGFYMGNKNGDSHRMSDDIQTEMIVPIYAPGSLQEPVLTSDDIVGVVNLEWVQLMSERRIESIGRQVAQWVQTEHRFPISPLVAELVWLVTGMNAHH